MAFPSLFAASLAWNFGHGMSWLAVPLYAHAQGLSNAEVGMIISLPVLAQAPLNLLGGAFADRLGGRLILLTSAIALAGAGLWLAASEGFWMLLAGQTGLVVSRAIFWPASWAMASEMPGERSRQLGRLNAVTNIGQIGGTVLCGVLLAAWGFAASFAAIAAAATIAFTAALHTPRPAVRTADSPAAAALGSYVPLLRNRTIVYSILCAYLSAVPFGLTLSFYPLLLVEYGYGKDESGLLLALRSVGAIAAALLAARFVRGGTATLWPVACGVAMAASVGLLPLQPQTAAIAFWILLAGVGAGAMQLYFQVTISEASAASARSSALALGGSGWNLALLTVPFTMGLLADRYGIVVGFYVIGAMTLALSGALAALRRWAAAAP